MLEQVVQAKVLSRRALDVGIEPFLAGSVFGNDSGALNARMGEQRAHDLAGFDTMTADLHLLVGTAKEIELPIGPKPHQVAGTIKAIASSRERVDYEFPRCQIRGLR